MKKILCPTDFSPTAENAFKYALKLAKDIDAKVDAVNVYSLPFAAESNMPPEYYYQMLGEKEKTVMEKLSHFTSGQINGNFGNAIAKNGIFIYRDITDLAQTEQYDLIVMGTKGEHNTFEKIMGSVTTDTMMNAPCPVLAIPEFAKYEQVKSIAYATDFAPKDEHAVEQLINISKILNAKVHFVHIETEPAIGDMKEMVEIDHYPFESTDFSLLNQSSVMLGLDEFIEKKDVNLLALFIPRRKLWERLFHRSFTKKMTFHSRTPLLVFHE